MISESLKSQPTCEGHQIIGRWTETNWFYVYVLFRVIFTTFVRLEFLIFWNFNNIYIISYIFLEQQSTPTRNLVISKFVFSGLWRAMGFTDLLWSFTRDTRALRPAAVTSGSLPPPTTLTPALSPSATPLHHPWSFRSYFRRNPCSPLSWLVRLREFCQGGMHQFLLCLLRLPPLRQFLFSS